MRRTPRKEDETEENRLELAREVEALEKAAKDLLEASHKTRELQEEADTVLAKAASLKNAARLEDLHLW